MRAAPALVFRRPCSASETYRDPSSCGDLVATCAPLRHREPPDVGGALTTLSDKEGGADFSSSIYERVTMRNALSLMLMSVVAATLIAVGGWFWTPPAGRHPAAAQGVAP